jgi:hypothetical protein
MALSYIIIAQAFNLRVSTYRPPKTFSHLRILLQLRLDSRLQRLGLRRTRPSLLHLPVLADQELLKIPLNPCEAHETRLALLHPLVHRLDVVAINVRLTEDREANAVVDLAEGLDFVVATGILSSELVARKAKDLEVWVIWLQFWSDCQYEILICVW